LLGLWVRRQRRDERPHDAAIAGVGSTDFTAKSGRSQLESRLQATRAALRDAGLDVDAIDGLCITYQSDANDPLRVAYALGLERVRFFTQLPTGARRMRNAPAGRARDWRGPRGNGPRVPRAERTERCPVRPADRVPPCISRTRRLRARDSRAPFRLAVHRYMYENGLSNQHFAPVSVTARAWAATNPRAYFHGRPITIETIRARLGWRSRCCACSTAVWRPTVRSRAW
jgi:acetyl-CoA acetyltransferase